MGATFPAVTRWVETTSQSISWMGLLYSANIAGAVTGCLLSGTACGTSDNVNIFFNLNTSCPAGYFGTSSFSINRLYSDIDQAGYGWAAAPNLSNNSWVRTVWHIKTVPCPAPHPLDYPN